MAFQYQSVAAISPAVVARFGVSLGEIGLLVSLYLVPGIFFSVPGGGLVQRFGDKRTVVFGLTLMIGGGFVMALSGSWAWQIGGRILAGIGGVLLNVVTAKTVSDWFSGRRTATAMAIFINSWPVGIAAALVALPPLVPLLGVGSVHLATCMVAVVGLLLISSIYKQSTRKSNAVVTLIWPTGPTLHGLLLSGLIWGLFNASGAMVFIYGTTLLVENGWSLTAAGSAVSLVFWLRGISIPIGGFLADQSRRPDVVMITGFLLSAVMLLVAAHTDHVTLSFVVLGLISGIPTGPVMSLPVRILTAELRAVGMGIYYTIYYLVSVAVPIFAGYVATCASTSRASFYLGAAMLVVCVIGFQLFRQYLVADGNPATVPS
jgi:MFS family permease